MADSTPRSRARSRAGGSRRPSTRSRSAASRRAASTRARSRSSSAARRSAPSRAVASRASANGSSASNGHRGALESLTGSIGSVATKARGPLIAGGAAAAGAIGGIVLGKRGLRTRKVLGIPVSRNGIGLKPLAHEVRKAGKQIERMADEVSKARAQAQKVGKALS